MAYQNFFGKLDNHKRKYPAQASGKNVFGEFRMRKNGQSIKVLKYEGQLNSDGTITSHITVFDADGNVAFQTDITCEK